MPKLNCPKLQTVLPQHLLSRFAGLLADSRIPWFKNWLIKRFMATYNIDLTDAMIQNPTIYPNFNEFFIRQLRPDARPIAQATTAIASPVDGCIAQIGAISQNRLLQAKGFDFNLEDLLGGDKDAATPFTNGAFTTLYLAPHNYHRVHMPLDGELIKTIYVPGKLFSVNRTTAAAIPNLYSRNELLITLFKTDAGTVAIILVGAMIVGSIQTAWMNTPVRSSRIITESFATPIAFKKGDEIGYFKLGSTVILLFEKNQIQWEGQLSEESPIRMGESLALLSC